jgi:predicted dehydrogenase
MAKSNSLRVLVVGCGHMGASHARAYRDLSGFELCGLVARTPDRRAKLAAEVGNPAQFEDYATALRETKPDVVSINTYPDTHARYARMALDAGAHLFMEKPIAETVKEAEAIVKQATRLRRKLVIGYILRVHPSWKKFIQLARGLGKPLVMRMNLNQQSHGANWLTHKSLMNSMSPIVDCGVHYVDVMCQMTRARPVRVSAIGARLTEELKPGMYNYGQLQVTFDDGSVGWYEAGWGPMMSTEAFFVKDVIGPKGSVTIAAASAKGEGKSDDVDSHSKTEALRLHHGKLNRDLSFARADEIIRTEDEPDHDELCKREQKVLLDAIRKDLDLTDHMNDAVNSLRIVLAADQAFRTGKMVTLKG